MSESKVPYRGVFAIAMRRFVIDRSQDVTGISGTGIILYGVEWFPGGPCDVYWLRTKTTGQYPSMAVVKSVHCYNENAQVVYIDPPPAVAAGGES